jgi:hypothetical protein
MQGNIQATTLTSQVHTGRLSRTTNVHLAITVLEQPNQRSTSLARQACITHRRPNQHALCVQQATIAWVEQSILLLHMQSSLTGQSFAQLDSSASLVSMSLKLMRHITRTSRNPARRVHTVDLLDSSWLLSARCVILAATVQRLAPSLQLVFAILVSTVSITL